MRLSNILVILAVLAGFSALLGTSYSYAAKSGIGFWWSGHWQNQDFKPYLNDSKIRHDSQWADDQWHPQDWIDERGSVEVVMSGFYDSRIITSQYVDDGVPVLEVGQRFVDLSDIEKRHVAAFVDYAYGVTTNAPAGLFRIQLIKRIKPLALYTKDGLQLQ